ncbi:pheromone precursor 1 [Fusarium sp. NRRL 52700]|nr:pheromone precursor 1 [Fusarium sp. NRRL 52700]
MKYSFVTLAAVAGAALAAPPPSAIDNFGPDFFTPFCNLDYKGKPCEELVGKGDKNSDAICKAGREHFCGPQKRDAVPEPQPDPVADPMPWCTWRGQPCWKEKMAKREAIAEPVAAPQPDPVAEPMPWCTWRGQPCWKEKMKAKREAEAIPEPIAAPQPDPVADPMPWCTWRGQPCWKEKMAKREAIPEPVAAPQPDPVADPMPWCTWRGQPCWKEKMAKREAIPEPVAAPQPDPVAEPMPWCTWRGQPCWKEKMRMAKREPEPVAAPQPDPVAEPMPWCTWRGQPCWKEKMRMAKRDAVPEPVAAPKPDPVAEPKPWCTWPGQPCWKKTKRAAAPEPAPEAENEPRWCMWRGQPCWKKTKRDATPEPWCMWRGQPCWKAKRDAAPEPWCMWRGQPCWKAKRDAGQALSNALHATRSLDTRSADAPSTAHLPRDAAHKAKRSIVELANLIALSARGSPEEYFQSLELETFFPDAAPNATAKRDLNTLQEDKRWCMWRGQPCWKAKRAAEAVLDAVDGDDGVIGPGGPDSHYDTRDFKAENFAAKRDLIAIKAAARSIADMSEE